MWGNPLKKLFSKFFCCSAFIFTFGCDPSDQDNSQAILCNEGGVQAICTRAPLNPEQYCCPTIQNEGNCTLIGGTMKENKSCTCQKHNGPWNETEDKNGCSYLIADDTVVDMTLPPDMEQDLGPTAIPCDDGKTMCDPSPLTPGKYCCPRTGPSCDCPYLGGTMTEFGSCDRICDAAPVDWTSKTDENGCITDTPGNEYCFPGPIEEDMGADLSQIDMNMSDMTQSRDM